MAHDADQMSGHDLPTDNRHALRLVARSCRKAALSTILAGTDGGAPYVSLVTVAFDLDLAPILLLSGLADHTRNLMADARCSVLLDGTDGHPNPQTGPRVTLNGRAQQVADERLRARFLGRHPGAALYAGFADFALWRVEPLRAHFVGGFGRAVWFDAPFGLRPEGTSALADAEAELLAEANSRWAAQLGEGWRLTAVDADGADLGGDAGFRRLSFRAPVDDPAKILAGLAESLEAMPA